MHRFLIVVEKARANYSAFAPDLPGCIATGETVDETRMNMQEAIELHLRGLKEDGLSVPDPTSFAEVVEVVRLAPPVNKVLPVGRGALNALVAAYRPPKS